MLESAHLINFRSHRDTFVEFHPGVNVFIGPNDSGKTNILRGVDLVINNRPRGDGYISDWGGDLDVKLGVDGKEVGRFRNVIQDKKSGKFNAGTTNQYTLTGEKPFEAVGVGVPEIIKQYLNISSINIAFQLDTPFLLGKNPPDVARHYNEIVDLTVIDTTISNIASTLRKEKGDRAVAKAEIEEKTEKLKEYDWLPKAEIELVKLEKTQRSIGRLKVDWTSLFELTRDFKKLTGASEKLDEIVRHDISVVTLLGQIKGIKKLESDIADLIELTDEFRMLTKTSHRLDEIVKYEKITNDLLHQEEDIKSLRMDVKDLTTIIEEINRLKKEETECQEIVKHADEAARLAELAAQITEAIGAYNNLLDLVEKWEKLSEQLSNVNDGLANLELEFREAMPEACPIFDTPCKHVEEARK